MVVGLKFELPKCGFLPGESVDGTVHWSLGHKWNIESRSPTGLIVRVGWFTRGEGQPDLCIHQERKWPSVDTRGKDTFTFDLPFMPCTYAGKLMHINWCLTAETYDGMDFTHEEIIVGPYRQPVQVQSRV